MELQKNFMVIASNLLKAVGRNQKRGQATLWVLAVEVLRLGGVGLQVVQLGRWGVFLDLPVCYVAVNMFGEFMRRRTAESVLSDLLPAESAIPAGCDVNPFALADSNVL